MATPPDNAIKVDDTLRVWFTDDPDNPDGPQLTHFAFVDAPAPPPDDLPAPPPASWWRRICRAART